MTRIISSFLKFGAVILLASCGRTEHTSDTENAPPGTPANQTSTAASAPASQSRVVGPNSGTAVSPAPREEGPTAEAPTVSTKEDFVNCFATESTSQATPAEEALLNKAALKVGDGFVFESIKCRTTLCKMEVTNPKNGVELGGFSQKMLLALSQTDLDGRCFSHGGFLSADGSKLTFFISVDGYNFPTKDCSPKACPKPQGP